MLAVRFTPSRFGILLLACACWGGAPASAQMQAQVRWMVYRNDTGMMPLRIQSGGFLPNGMPRFGQPHLVPGSGKVGVPGAVAWDPIVGAGPKVILITDPQNPARVYYRGQVLFGNQNQFYSIQSAGMGPNKVPMVRLVPLALPAAMNPPKR